MLSSRIRIIRQPPELNWSKNDASMNSNVPAAFETLTARTDWPGHITLLMDTRHRNYNFVHARADTH